MRVEDLELGGAADQVYAVAPAAGAAEGDASSAKVIQGVGELSLIGHAINTGP